MASKKELEAKLTLQQRKAALILVERELSDDEEKQKKTHDEIAEELGIARMTMYRWRTQNKEFIEYVNLLADDFLSSQRAFVYRQLLKTIDGQQPSIKGIDLFLRRHGLLTDKQVTETVDSTNSRSNEDIEKELEDLDNLLRDEES